MLYRNDKVYGFGNSLRLQAMEKLLVLRIVIWWIGKLVDFLSWMVNWRTF